MPRPVGQWILPEDEERALIARIGDSSIGFREFAEGALRLGYAESKSIKSSGLTKSILDRELTDFDALPPAEIARLNNEQHASIVSNLGILRQRLITRRARYQAILQSAQSFLPPSAEHQAFADYLTEKVGQAISDIQIPGDDPAQSTPAAFKAQRRASLQAAVDRSGREVEKHTVADVQWVEDLLAALP